MKERRITLGLIEAVTQLQFFPQEGLEKIAAELEWQAARSYYIGKEELNKMKVQQAVDRWKNTDEERNIRVSLLMPFENPREGMTLLETNLKYFSDVKTALSARNFVFGPAGTFHQLHVNLWLRALVVLGAVAAGVPQCEEQASARHICGCRHDFLRAAVYGIRESGPPDGGPGRSKLFSLTGDDRSAGLYPQS